MMNSSEFDGLQKVQNRALRIILSCSRYTRISSMLETTNVLSVRQTVTYNTLIFIYKMLNGKLPDHLLSNCKFVSDVHKYNTRSTNNFYVNRVNSSFSQNSLFYRGLQYYNTLPNNIKDCNTLNAFMKSCRIYVKQNVSI